MKAKTLKELFETEHIQKINNTLLLKKRELLLDNLFISEDIDCEIYNRDDKMMILIVEAFDKMYISLRSATIDIPDRCWINADGSVLVASGQNDPFLPIIDGNKWYCGDEVYQVGVWTEEDTKDCTRMPKRYNQKTELHEIVFDHSRMMCIPTVKYYGVTEDTANVIWKRYGNKINNKIKI